MRKIPALLIGAATLAGVVAAPAGADTTLSARVTATPGDAGTAKRPHGVKLTIGFDLTTTEGQTQPTVTAFEVWHGPGLAFDRGKGYAECAQNTLAKMGPDGCPKKSVLGRGPALAVEPPLEWGYVPKMVIVNGPRRVPLAYVTLQVPARVRAVMPSTAIDRPRSIWPHRTSWTIPESMRVVAGIPITFNHLAYIYGYTKSAELYVSSTSCPRGGWRWRVRVHTVDAAGGAAVLTQDGRAPCRR